jgi:hypothetical protein
MAREDASNSNNLLQAMNAHALGRMAGGLLDGPF